MWTRVIPRWNAGISKCTHAIDHARSDDDYIYRSVHNTASNSTAVCVYTTDATCLHLYRHHAERLIDCTLERQTHQYTRSLGRLHGACVRVLCCSGCGVCGCCVVVHPAKTSRRMVQNNKKVISYSRLDSWKGCEISPVGAATAEVAARAGGRCRSFVAAAKRAARLVGEIVDLLRGPRGAGACRTKLARNGG